MTIFDYYKVFDELYPQELSCDWDNDGIMCCCNLNNEVSKVLVSLDATRRAVDFAIDHGFDTLLTHHPMIFHSMDSVVNGSLTGSRVVDAIKGNLNVVSLHTRLDAGKNGVNDMLVEKLGFVSAGSFGDCNAPALGRYFDLDKSVDSKQLVWLCKERLGCETVKMTGNNTVHRVSVVGGSGSDLIDSALSIGSDLLITGECSYNAAQDAAERGLCIIEAGHFETEFPVCERLREITESLNIVCQVFNSRDFQIF